jgi:hypothetical protein
MVKIILTLIFTLLFQTSIFASSLMTDILSSSESAYPEYYQRIQINSPIVLFDDNDLVFCINDYTIELGKTSISQIKCFSQTLQPRHLQKYSYDYYQYQNFDGPIRPENFKYEINAYITRYDSNKIIKAVEFISPKFNEELSIQTYRQIGLYSTLGEVFDKYGKQYDIHIQRGMKYIVVYHFSTTQGKTGDLIFNASKSDSLENSKITSISMSLN